MKNFFKTLLRITLIIISLPIIYLNFSLYYQPNFSTTNGQSYNQDVYHQLRFVKRHIENKAAYDMQDIYPEGYVFLYTIYGLTWCNLIEHLDEKSPIYQEGIEEIRKSVKAVHSPIAKSTFGRDVPLEYGAFYRGWTNLLLGRQLQIQREKAPEDVEFFKKNCDDIAAAMRESESPYLEAYATKTWPADGLIAAASIDLHDEIFEPTYQKDIQNYVAKMKTKLDPETGLLPHKVNMKGMTIESARGCSQSLILLFLKDIDEQFANEQFEIYKELFLDYRLGLPGFREYPKGQDGEGDVDSGPVIWEIGGVASIVGQRMVAKYENWTLYEGLRNCIKSFGGAYTRDSERKYIFGQLVIVDVFTAWSNSIEHTENQVENTSNWRLRFHLLSLALILLIGFIFFRLK